MLREEGRQRSKSNGEGMRASTQTTKWWGTGRGMAVVVATISTLGEKEHMGKRLPRRQLGERANCLRPDPRRARCNAALPLAALRSTRRQLRAHRPPLQFGSGRRG